MFNLNISTNDNRSVFIIGSVITYYFFRLLFQIVQSQFPDIMPINLPRSNVSEIQELTVLILLSFLFGQLITNKNIMTTVSWSFFLVMCFFSTILGFSNRMIQLREVIRNVDVGSLDGTPINSIMNYEVGISVNISRLILIILGVVISFYSISLLHGNPNWIVWIVIVMMITFIYIGWLLSQTAEIPYQFPWWWFYLFLMILISKQKYDNSKIYGWCLWACWGVLVGMLASQGLLFWCPSVGTHNLLELLDTELFQRLYHSLGLLKAIQSSSINQLLQTIGQTNGINGNTTQFLTKLDGVQERLRELERDNKTMRTALQFIILIPVTLSIWWWIQSA